MSDLIDRQAAIDAIDEYDFEFPNYMERFVTELRDAMKADLKNDIEALPSAQPERESGEVHAHWKDAVQGCHDSPLVLCSACGEYYWQYFKKFNYCPNCGAKMDGGE